MNSVLHGFGVSNSSFFSFLLLLPPLFSFPTHPFFSCWHRRFFVHFLLCQAARWHCLRLGLVMLDWIAEVDVVKICSFQPKKFQKKGRTMEILSSRIKKKKSYEIVKIQEKVRKGEKGLFDNNLNDHLLERWGKRLQRFLWNWGFQSVAFIAANRWCWERFM